MAADQDRERLEELEGRYVVLAEEHHEEFVFRKAAEAELTAAKAERNFLAKDVMLLRAELVMLRNDKHAAEADAARCRTNLAARDDFIVGRGLWAEFVETLPSDQALQPHKETK